MQLTPKQIDLLTRRSIVAFATADSKGKSRVIIVEANKAEGDKIIITDNEMLTTKNNILENNQVAISANEADYSYCLKITGTAEYQTTGEYFEYVKNVEGNKTRNPKGVIIITLTEVLETS